MAPPLTRRNPDTSNPQHRLAHPVASDRVRQRAWRGSGMYGSWVRDGVYPGWPGGSRLRYILGTREAVTTISRNTSKLVNNSVLLVLFFSSLTSYDQLSAVLDQFGPVLTGLAMFGPSWPCLARLSPSWPVFGRSGPP